MGFLRYDTIYKASPKTLDRITVLLRRPGCRLWRERPSRVRPLRRQPYRICPLRRQPCRALPLRGQLQSRWRSRPPRKRPLHRQPFQARPLGVAAASYATKQAVSGAPLAPFILPILPLHDCPTFTIPPRAIPRITSPSYFVPSHHPTTSSLLHPLIHALLLPRHPRQQHREHDQHPPPPLLPQRRAPRTWGGCWLRAVCGLSCGLSAVCGLTGYGWCLCCR